MVNIFQKFWLSQIPTLVYSMVEIFWDYWWNTPYWSQTISSFFLNPLPTFLQRTKSSTTFAFCTKFFLPWIFNWEVEIITHDDLPTLVCKFKVKWWNKFQATNNINKAAVQKCFQQKEIAQSSLPFSKAITGPLNPIFLVQKSNA